MNYLARTIPSRVLVSSLLLIIAFMASVEVTQAKRVRSSGMSYLTGRDVKMRRGGCASFGHSCFGGHGKRAVPVVNAGDPEEIPVGIQRPNDDLIGEGSLPQMEIFSRDEGQLDANGLNMFLKQQKYRDPDDFGQFSSFLRKWVSLSVSREELKSFFLLSTTAEPISRNPISPVESTSRDAVGEISDTHYKRVDVVGQQISDLRHSLSSKIIP